MFLCVSRRGGGFAPAPLRWGFVLSAQRHPRRGDSLLAKPYKFRTAEREPPPPGQPGARPATSAGALCPNRRGASCPERRAAHRAARGCACRRCGGLDDCAPTAGEPRAAPEARRRRTRGEDAGREAAAGGEAPKPKRARRSGRGWRRQGEPPVRGAVRRAPARGGLPGGRRLARESFGGVSSDCPLRQRWHLSRQKISWLVYGGSRKQPMNFFDPGKPGQP